MADAQWADAKPFDAQLFDAQSPHGLPVSQLPRVLISTIEPFTGGVPAKVRWVVGELRALGLEPVLAWYEPWSRCPRLSVPLHALASGRRPGHRPRILTADLQPAPGDSVSSLAGGPGAPASAIEAHGIGAWLPELEFTHYLPGRHWQRLIASCQLHLAVTGNPLCAYRYTASGIPFLAWIGTPWHGDRVDRVRRFPLPRRLLDRLINAPVLRQQERRVLGDPKGRILTISRHTARELEAIGGRPPAGVLYLPPDARLFHPDAQRRVPWRLGFSGRYSDPRKHIELLLQALRILVAKGHPAELHLSGERDASFLQPQIDSLGLQERVICHPYLSPAELAQLHQSLDLFVIPSHQEGLCIAALEAMACGAPVVSTRCGGPEDFVLEGQTGSLVDADPQALAGAMIRICSDRHLQQNLSTGAWNWVQAHASADAGRTTFRRHLAAVAPSGWLQSEI